MKIYVCILSKFENLVFPIFNLSKCVRFNKDKYGEKILIC